MPRDKTAAHARIMAAAREEFLEFGYEKASMRSVGERCGMTAAGLYRHCRDKADLFDQLVSPAAERVKAWTEAHVSRYSQAIRAGKKALWQDSWVDMMREVVYPHIEDYHLLLVKSQGTKYADFLHDMTLQSQERFYAYFPYLRAQGYPIREISAKELHMLLTAYVTALFEPVTHYYSQEEALNCLNTVEDFFLPGWKQLLGF